MKLNQHLIVYCSHITDKVSNGLIRSQLFIYTGHDKRTLAVHKRSFKQRQCAAASPPSTTFRLVKGHLRMCVVGAEAAEQPEVDHPEAARSSSDSATRVGQSGSIGELSRLILHPVPSPSTLLLLMLPQDTFSLPVMSLRQPINKHFPVISMHAAQLLPH